MNIKANVTFQAGNFARLEAVIVPRIIAAVESSSALVYDTSQQLVPVDTGELQSSGAKSVALLGQRVVGTVSYSAHHASFVEFGTGIIGSGTYPYDLPMQGVPITGQWIYDYKHQNWQGMAARPYLRPALDMNQGSIVAAFGRHGV